ncbi:hypothetical protein S83_057112, partial [Arachis hypogaea]
KKERKKNPRSVFSSFRSFLTFIRSSTAAELSDPLPPSVAIRGVSLRTVGVIQVEPPFSVLPRSAPILHKIRPARDRPVAVAVAFAFASSPSRCSLLAILTVVPSLLL